MRAALSLVLGAIVLPAYAQVNKCTDANGRISYQANPCPGSSTGSTLRNAPSKAGAPQQPAPSVAPAPASALAQPPLPDHAAKDCAERSDSLVRNLERGREYANKVSPQGGRADMTKRLVDEPKAEFVRSCSRFGFAAPDSADLVEKNRALSQRIQQQFKLAYDKRLQWETKQRADAPPPPRYVGRSATAQSAGPDASRAGKVGWPSEEEQNMRDCADSWETEMSIRRDVRGKLPAKLAAETDQRAMVHFMPKCAKYGFEWPRDQAGEKRNEKVLEDLKAKIDATEAARNQAAMQSQLERQAADRAREQREEAERERVSKAMMCEDQRKFLAGARASMDKMEPAQRDAYRRQLETAEQDLRKNCG
jgi:hypothetical protein